MESMRRFAGLELGEDVIPDETTILNFRHLLEQHNLTNAVFEAVKVYFTEQGLLPAGGSIVDATIIHAPPSTKNQAKQRDSEISSTNLNTRLTVLGVIALFRLISRHKAAGCNRQKVVGLTKIVDMSYSLLWRSI